MTPRPAEGRGLPRRIRLTRASQFHEIYRTGRKAVGRLMVMWTRADEGADRRVGVVASRKVGGAVQRNRARRLLREAYRINRPDFHGALDVVLVARRDILKAGGEEVSRELRRLAEKTGLL
jgi:ribonuclease P protein component